MATKKTPVNTKLLEVVQATPPINPAMTGADRTFLRGLKRRGYSNDEIIAIGKKAGFSVKQEDLAVKTRKAKVGTAQSAKAPVQG